MRASFCLPRRPKAFQCKGGNTAQKTAYQEEVRAAAHLYRPERFLQGSLYSRIIWFHRQPGPQGDIDNILKLIHDALKQVLYTDDSMIVRTASFRIDIGQDYQLDPDPETSTNSDLLALLDNTVYEHILYIEVGEFQGQHLRLGRVE